MLEGRSHLPGLDERRLLVVDNDTRIVEVLKTTFENEGYGVDVSFCGEAAIVKNGVGMYPCVILDYSLPDMKGDEVAEKLRASNPKVCLVLLTGFKSAMDSSKLRLFDWVFEKPADMELLVATIGELIRHGKKESAPEGTKSFIVTPGQAHGFFDLGKVDAS